MNPNSDLAKDFPRERLIKYGTSLLMDKELIAILLRTGTKNKTAIELSNDVLEKLGSLGNLNDISVEQLIKFPGLGVSKACSLKAAGEIALRIKYENTTRKKITHPKDVFLHFSKIAYEKKVEHMYVLSLTTRNEIIAEDLISIGTINETLIHPREVYRIALARNAVSIILVHNHPSGNPNPSNEDIGLSKRIQSAGIIMGIGLIDHVVVSANRYVSLREKGHLEYKDFDDERR